MLRTGSASKQLTLYYSHWVKPVQCLCWRALRDSLVVVALAVVPQADLVEVVQAERSCNAVDQRGVWYARRDDICEVESDEVPVNGRLGVSDFDENEEDDGEEEEEGGDPAEDGSGTHGEGWRMEEVVEG